MEYMDGGSLDLVLKKTGKIPEPYSRKITYAVSTLVVYAALAVKCIFNADYYSWLFRRYYEG